MPPPAAADCAVDQLAGCDELDADELDVDELEFEFDEPPQAATVSAAPTAPAASSRRLARQAHETPQYLFKVPPRCCAAARTAPRTPDRKRRRPRSLDPQQPIQLRTHQVLR
jgi:hypothetical protein